MAVNSPLAGIVLNNLSVLAMFRGELVRAEEFIRAARDLAQQLGDRESIRFSHANLLFQLMQSGRWDETLEDADRFIAECETSPHNMETAARETRAHVRFARGDAEGAFEDWEHGLALARAMGSPERLIPALLDLGHAFALLGRLDEARAYILEGMNVARANPALAALLGRIAGESDRLGVTLEVDEIISQAPEGPWKDVGLAELHGEGARAADMFRRMGATAIEADVRIAAAEALLEEGRTAEGLAELEKALTFYRSVGATFFLDRGEALLAEAKTA
jgi:tetratricopeptide (TPR) repeat protein